MINYEDLFINKIYGNLLSHQRVNDDNLLKINISITNDCNQQCYYCNNYDINYNSNDIINIDLDYLKYSLDLFNKNGINNLYIEISGGEPGLISNINELIKTLCSLKNVYTKTNCFFYVK